MRTILIFLQALILTTSCKKESDTFIPRYELIKGIWKTQSMSYDSSGVFVTKTLRYDRLVISEDLTYKIYYDVVNEIETGTISIITQTDTKLELYFEAKYPGYSSFAGSHIFANSKVYLISLTQNDLILRDVDDGYFSPREFRFIKF